VVEYGRVNGNSGNCGSEVVAGRWEEKWPVGLGEVRREIRRGGMGGVGSGEVADLIYFRLAPEVR